MEFSHLHVHTQYSLLDGSSKIRELISRVKELGMKSIAITDHGVMYGILSFYKEAAAQGIKPVLGCEIYVSSGSRFDKSPGVDTNYYHLVLLAENNEGYQNLMRLVSLGFTEGFYYKPRVDIELLKKYHRGIIGLSACLGGIIPKVLLTKGYAAAKETAILYNEIFGKNNFYLELQDHGIPEQAQVNHELLRMSDETGIPLVATNDCHYIGREDSGPHDILLCIQTGKTITDEDRMKYEGDQFYVKSPDEMAALFPYAPQAIENAVKIADRCNVEIEFHKLKLPKFDTKEQPYEYLRKISMEGLKKRYPGDYESFTKRLNFELETIFQMGFVDYFLIVWDFIRHAKEKGISVGPGRGSAAGSLVSYCLNITNIDPIRYNLLFERFLNPERVSMPDIDIDFCYERRQEVIDYVIQKYGEDHVAQIITFGTMAARLAIRDVGRALAMPYGEVDKIAKMVPFAIGMTIEHALEMNQELKNQYDTDEGVKYLIDMSKKLEGLPRHASTHAAGVVICERPVMEYVPLNTNDGAVTTQFTMNELEELGLLKMDFLGLRTLTVIDNAVKEIKRNHGIDIDIDNLDLDDQSVYAIFSAAKTDGVFQFESSGMKAFLKELKPSSIEDIVAGVALYRPGPMDFIPKYIEGKNTSGKIKYAHPLLEPILKETYGCIVYQEQVMRIVRDLAGYSLGHSDLMRRAMSKKKSDVMIKERENFVNGCEKNGIAQDISRKIYDDMADFAKYAFNKSHAAAYALVAYQTAWLKKHFPVEFMAALMTSVMYFTSKVTEYIDAAKKMGIDISPPDINKGFAGFSVSEGKILFGLAAIKNVGKNIINEIVAEREKNGEYISFMQFAERLSDKDLNKRCIEGLIKAGAFDSLGGRRAQYMNYYKQVLDGISGSRKRNFEGQLDLFGFSGKGEAVTANSKDELPAIEEYDLKYMLSLEKEALGIYVSGHPLSEFEGVLNRLTSARSPQFMVSGAEAEEFNEYDKELDGKKVIIGGMIISKTLKFTKNNKTMAFITVEDLYGTIEVLVFPNVYEKLTAFSGEEAVIIKGRASFAENEDGKVIAEEILPITAALAYNENKRVNGEAPRVKEPEKEFWVKIPSCKADKNDSIMNGLSFIFDVYKGYTPVIIYNEASKTKKRMSIGVNAMSESLATDVSHLLGEKCAAVKYLDKGKV